MELFWRLNVAKLLQEQEGRRRVGWELGGAGVFRGNLVILLVLSEGKCPV